MRHAYTAILEQDPEGGYVVWVPALPGCVTHGDSMGEALLMVEDAACLYLEDLAASGETEPPDVGEVTLETIGGRDRYVTRVVTGTREPALA